MCGISGIVSKPSTTSLPADTAERIRHSLEAMIYRGPDNHNVLAFEQCFLGHARLKIIDLSDAANQPMSDTTGRYHIVFNGEIFNHIALKNTLQAKGISFRTHSDTEVLLQMLIHRGLDALNELNGFFAFAFYDNQEKTVLLARDRFGEKPLWYCNQENNFTFASELKALCAYDIPKKVDPVSLHQLLQYSYIPAPDSILQGVRKLEAGHCIIIKQGQVTIERWYQPAAVNHTETPDTKVRFRYLLEDAVKLRLQSDVPLGCFLSGGLDSSIIAMLASRNHSKLHTFSVGFSDQPFLDESKYATMVAKHIGSEHEIFELDRNMMLEETRKIFGDLEEPFADSSSIAVSLLSRLVRKKVTVALSGDGADELFGGYNKHAALLASQQKNILNSALPTLRPILDILPEGRNNFVLNKIRQVKKYASILEENMKGRYLHLASWSDEAICKKLIGQEMSLRIGARMNRFVQDINQDDFNTIFYVDQKMVLANDMLVKVDRMSMLHSLEVRPPFLDYRVVEFANSLPVNQKISSSKRKILLQETFQNDLPKEIFSRRKMGFEVPLESWLRNELKPMVYDLLSPESLQSKEFLNKEEVKNVLAEFYQQKNNRDAHLIYALMVFESWYRNFKKYL